MARAYSTRPSQILGMEDKMMALAVDHRCFLAGKGQQAKRVGEVAKQGLPVMVAMKAEDL